MNGDEQIRSLIQQEMAQETPEMTRAPATPQPDIESNIRQEIQNEIRQEKYTTPTQTLVGLGEAGLRGLLTGPGATALETALGVPKEEIAGRREQLGAVPEFFAEATGFLLPTLATAGLGALATRTGISGFTAAQKAAQVASAFTQAGALQKAGQIGAKVVAGEAAKKAIAFGIEGALVGAMEPVTKQMLSSEPVDLMTTASNVAVNMTAGGAFGGALGYGIGKVSPIWKASITKNAQKAIDDVIGANGIPLSSMEMAERFVPQAEKEALKTALGKQMPNKGLFVKEANRLGIPVTDAMTSDSSLIQRIGGSLIDGPSVPAYLEKLKYDKGFERVNKIVTDTLASELPEGISKAELGDLIINTIEPKVRKRKDLVDVLYNEIRKETQFVPVELNDLQKVTDRILNSPRVLDNPRSPSARFAKDLMSDILERAQSGEYTVENLQSQIATINERVGLTASERSFGYEVRDLLNDLRNKQIIKFAEQMPVPTAEAEAATKSLIEQIKIANKEYGPFAEQLKELAKGIGFKVSGPADFLIKLSETKPEKIVDRLFAKGDVSFLKFLQENGFSDELKAVMDYQKAQLLQKFSIKDTLRSAQLIKEVTKLPKEIRRAMFTEQQLKDLDFAQWWLSRVSKLNINPSKTSMGIAFNEYFTGKALIMNIADTAKVALIKAHSSGAQPKATAFKALNDYFFNAHQGAVLLQKMGRQLFTNKEISIEEPNEASLRKLDSRAKQAELDPKTLQDSDNELYHYAPKEYLAAKTLESRVLNYVNQKRPKPRTSGVLGREIPPTTSQLADFKRTLQIANQPQIIFKKIQNGTLQSKDVQDLNAMYPELRNEMLNDLVKNVIYAKSKKTLIPNKMKKALSVFGAMPLDFTLTPQAIQAAQSTYQPKNLPMDQSPQMAPKSTKKSRLPELTETDQQRRMLK